MPTPSPHKNMFSYIVIYKNIMAFHDFARENYFGNTFEGKECNKLLKKIDELREIIAEEYHI